MFGINNPDMGTHYPGVKRIIIVQPTPEFQVPKSKYYYHWVKTRDYCNLSPLDLVGCFFKNALL